MTLSPSPPRGNAIRPDRGLARGLMALVFLVALVVVPPLALTTFVGNPLPEHAVIGGRLSDDAVIGMLAAVVWLAWAQLMLAVLIEAIAAARGAGLPRRIPLCGPQQHLARQLVVAVAFLLAGTATATGVHAGTAAANGYAAAEVCAPADVHHGEPLTSDAPEVVLAMAEIDRSASARTERGPSTVDAGPGADPVGMRADRGLWYVVEPPQGRYHDTLWDIAERHLGDGRRWKEIYELNRHRPQPDGHRLEVARLIYPGWRLLLPADAIGIPAAGHKAAAPDLPTAQGGHVPGAKTAAETRAKTPSMDARPAVPPARTAPPPMDAASSNSVRDRQPRPAEPKIQPLAGEHQGAATIVDDGTQDDSPAVPFGSLTLGLSAIAAAGLTSELARRRRRAQRLRPPGARLRRPEAEPTQAEQQLRTVNAEITVTTVRDALRVLAADCHATGRALPDVHAVLVNATTIQLRLGSDEPDPAGPFIATGPRTWTLAEHPDPGVIADDDVIDPYPALVSVGIADDTVVLINLEAAGALHIDGPGAGEIAYAMTAELGTSVLSADAELVLTGCPAELAGLTDPGRTRRLAPDAAARWAQARVRTVGDLLAEAGLRDLADARGRRMASDLWTPAVLVDLAAPGTGADEAGRRAARPLGGLSVITTRPAASGGDGWTLCATGGAWRLEPLGIDVEPQRLNLDALSTLDGMLEVPEPDEPDATAPAGGSLPGDPRSRTGSQVDPTRVRITKLATASSASPTDLAAIAAAIPHPPLSAPKQAVDGHSVGVAPRVLVLGPVDVTGMVAERVPTRRRRPIELICYLALHPGATQHQLDEALWPGRRVARNTRNPLVSRTRQWLGATEGGEPYLAHVAEGGTYSIRDEVTSDWHDFCALSHRGLAAGADGADDLVAALELVRGRPFLGVNPAAYSWAEAGIQDMISAVVDVAHALSELSLATGDHRRARWAATRGLLVEPCAELLYQDAMRAARTAGDLDDVERLAATLRRQVAEVDPLDDIDAATGALLDRGFSR